MIGGAPVTQSYADEIGADGYAPDAASAADVAKKLYGVASRTICRDEHKGPLSGGPFLFGLEMRWSDEDWNP